MLIFCLLCFISEDGVAVETALILCLTFFVLFMSCIILCLTQSEMVFAILIKMVVWFCCFVLRHLHSSILNHSKKSLSARFPDCLFYF